MRLVVNNGLSEARVLWDRAEYNNSLTEKIVARYRKEKLQGASAPAALAASETPTKEN